ncbi:MAG: acyl carrier protein, partial [Deltaproteobacteria bacterium]|nr:acyl carrier protein [Deltaproteobacteria bacterium]
MTREDLRSQVLKILGSIAPEADLTTLDPQADLRETVDLDSMDLLNFATRIHQKLGVDVPEADERQLVTLRGCVAYLARRL